MRQLTWVWIVVIIVSCIPMISWAGSSVSCSAGQSYDILNGGGCCGDGVVNGPMAWSVNGEQCDNGFAFNYWSAQYESVPPGTNNIPCTSSCSPTTYGAIGSCQYWNDGNYYKVGELGSLYCDGGALNRRLYSDSSCTINAGSPGVLPNDMYMAGCVSPSCGGSLHNCSAGSVINRNGNAWQCSYGGTNRVDCSISSCTTEICGDGIDQDCNGSDLACPPTCTTEICGDGIDQDCNGSDLACAFSCGGSIPNNGSACNSTAPGSPTNWDIVGSCGGAGACKYECVNGTIPSGTSCITENYTLYKCTSHNTWTSYASCPGSTYNGSATYSLNNEVCRLTSDGTPSAWQCVVCAAGAGDSCNSTPNACGRTNQGTIQCNGVCSASTPTNPANYGNSCNSTANNCGDTNVGTVQCNGTCSAGSQPADRNPCTCASNVGSACNSSTNACGQFNQGTIQCDGSCSASTPVDPPNVGDNCTGAPNACGQTNQGTIQCNGMCSASTPSNPANYGNSCNSAPNNCNETRVGNIQCNGTCSAGSQPADRNPCSCVSNEGSICTSAPNNCKQTNQGLVECDGSCSVGSPANPANYGNSCNSAANNCNETSQGTIQCNGSCGASKPADRTPCSCASNAGFSCSSTANNCGETNMGTVNCVGTCGAAIPADRNPCVVNPPINGVCGSSNYTCNAGTNQYVNSSQWRCNGINNGSSATCNVVVLPYCGDGVVNQTWEQCEGSQTTNNPKFRSCIAGSCQWGGCTPGYACTSLNGRQRDVDSACNIDGSIETNYGYCCQGSAPNASWGSAPAAGSSMSNIRCTDGVNIAWDQPNGNCGTQTTVKRCDDWSGRPGGAAFGSDGNRDGYVCSNNKCGAEPNLVSRVYLCNLTGAAAAQLCTDILPVNLPFGGYWPPQSGGSVFVGAETQSGKWKNRDQYDDLYIGLRENSGSLIQQTEYTYNNTTNQYEANGYKPNPRLIDVLGFQHLTPGSSYHSFMTMFPNSTGSLFPAGWVLLRGPSSGAVTYGLTHQSTLEGGSFGWSTLVNSGLRVTMGQSKAYGYYYFYCSYPGGNCPKPYRFSINAFYDKENNGIGGNDDGLGNVLVNILSGGVLLYSGRTITDVNQPSYYDWYNGANPFNARGSYTATLLGGSTYTVVVYPPSGYAPSASAPYHYVGASDLNNGSSVNSAGLPSIPWSWDSVISAMRSPAIPGPITGGWTSLSGTSFTITMPEMDTYVRTRLSGVPANLSLQTNIVNPQLGYSIGDTIQVNYLLKNIGYQALDQTVVRTHVLTGLQVIPNSMIFSGNCDSEIRGAPRAPTGHALAWLLSTGNVDGCGSPYYPGTDSVNCACTNPSNGAACDLTFLNKSLITWSNNGGGPVIDQSIYPGIIYPPLATDLDTQGQNNYQGAYKKVLPKGQLVSIGRGSDGGANLQPGAVCEVQVSYRIQPSAVTGQTYTYRSCARPRYSSDLTIPWIQDNCDNVNIRIGLPSCALPPSLGTGTITQGSGIVARRDNLITPSDSITRCESEYRTCNNTILSGSFLYPSCVRQCFQIWTGTYGTTGINPGSNITGQASLISNPLNDTPSCVCEQAPLSCVATQITGGALADPSGRPYTGGRMQGLLNKYTYPSTIGCQQNPTCNPGCQVGADIDLYELNYSMSGNTALSQSRVVDQVHPNICIKPSSFTGRIATNEVRITFFSGSNTGVSYPLLTNVSGSSLAGNTGRNNGLSYTNIIGQTFTGYVCGPYVQYDFVRPLNPGAKGYFFYEYKIKDSISQNPNANSGSNCVWIYRQSNTGVSYDALPPTILTAMSSGALATLDPGDIAYRFIAPRWTSYWTLFNPLGELISSAQGGNNYVCVPPPSSTCPANTIQQNTLFPINICGNGVQELNEECDAGLNNNDSGLIRFTGLALDDKLYDNYCKTDCTLGSPLVCNWTASCSNANVTSIQSGEQYPFWWNLGTVLSSGAVYNTGFTSICNQLEHVNKIIYVPGVSVPMCTFELFNFDTSTGTSLYQFTAPCVGTGVTGLQMFSPTADKWVHERVGILGSAISPINANGTVVSTIENTGNIISSVNSYTLDQIRPSIVGSQGSKIIPMTNIVTQGRLGEYEIRLTKLSYTKCNQEGSYTEDIYGVKTFSGYQYTLKTGEETAPAGFCANQFIVTAPYTIQEGSLLSTLDPADFSKFYTSANRLADQNLDSTYGNLVARNTQIPTYISTLGVNSQNNSKFISQFVAKYTKLASEEAQIVTYSHSFKNLSGAQSSPSVILYKVPTREIYVYTGSQPLFVSDYGFSQLSSANTLRSSTNLTLIATNAPIIVFGDLTTKNIMLITNQTISFAGGSLSKDPQQVEGIFVAISYDGTTRLTNIDSSKRWIDDGRLVVRGILIGGNIDALSKSRRSVIENWYNGSGSVISDSAVLVKRKKSLVEGASLRIVPNPQLFISPPPGATELFESLSVVK